MKTPFDAVVRLNQRAVEEVRLSISVEVRQIADIEQTEKALVEEVEAEVIAASEDWQMSTHHYLRDRARRGARLAETRGEHEQTLARLREEAAQAYGALHVAQEAQRQFAAEARGAQERKDQAEMDDIAAAKRLATRRKPAPRGTP